MSSETIIANDQFKAEMAALVPEKIRTGAYLTEIEESMKSLPQLQDLTEKWKEWSVAKLRHIDNVALNLKVIKQERFQWYAGIQNIAIPVLLSKDIQTKQAEALSACSKHHKEFPAISEFFDAGLSDLVSIRQQLFDIHQKFEMEHDVLELAIGVHRNKVTIEFLEDELKEMKTE